MVRVVATNIVMVRRRYIELRGHTWCGRTRQMIRSHASKFSNTFCCMSHEGEVYFQQQNITWASSKTSKWSKSKSKSEVKWNITIAYRRDWTTASTPGLIDISYVHTLPLCHWGHVICSKLVLYMSPMAYLGKAFTPKRYRTCYILQGPVFRCKFNRDVH